MKEIIKGLQSQIVHNKCEITKLHAYEAETVREIKYYEDTGELVHEYFYVDQLRRLKVGIKTMTRNQKMLKGLLISFTNMEFHRKGFICK